MPDGFISCDDHMDLGQLPADLWETRLPASLRDRAPRVEERDGQAIWICDGKAWGRWDGKLPATGSARPIKPIYTALDRAGIHDNSARRPANAKLRLTDMDRDGVQTQLIFGPIFQISTDDPVLRTACYRVFNDWLLDFCAAVPGPADRRADVAGKPRGRIAGVVAARGERRGPSGQPDDRQHQPEARRSGVGTAMGRAGIERHHLGMAHHGVCRTSRRPRRRQGCERVREYQVLSRQLP